MNSYYKSYWIQLDVLLPHWYQLYVVYCLHIHLYILYILYISYNNRNRKFIIQNFWLFVLQFRIYDKFVCFTLHWRNKKMSELCIFAVRIYQILNRGITVEEYRKVINYMLHDCFFIQSETKWSIRWIQLTNTV